MGCQKDPAILKEVTFNVGFESSGRFSGSFTDSILKKDIVLFGDAMTKQKLSYFDTDGKFIKDVDLSSQAKALGSIDYIWLSGMDSINLLSPNRKKIVCINSSGEKMSEMHLQNMIYENGDIYNYTAAFEPSIDMVFNGSTFLRSEWRENINNPADADAPHSIKNYFESYNNTINIVSVAKMKNGSLKKKAIISGFYKNISTVVQAFPEGVAYSIVNQKLFMTSSYSNKVFIFNPQNGKLIKTVEINSNYTTFNISGFNLDPKSIENLQSLVTTSETAGIIGSIFFDKYDDQYFVLIAHGVPSQKEKHNRNFSIIKYNNHFKKVDEVYFDNKKFNWFSAMMIDNKVWLQYKNTLPTIKKYAVLDL